MSSSGLLPLTPFERYQLADTQPGFPMEASMQMHFGGPLDADLLTASLPLALHRHPLLTARVTGRGRRRCWQLTDNPTVSDVFAVAPWASPFLADRSPHFNLTERPGLRMQLQNGSQQSVLQVAAHHAVADGVGIFQFIADWLAIYQARWSGESDPTFPTIAVDALATRGRPRWILAEPITRWQALRGTVREASRWLLRRPRPLSGTRQSTTLEPPLPGLMAATLSAAETRTLRTYAKDQKASLNDLLLRDLFVTLAKWQEESGVRAKDWIRINVPTNLRLAGEPPTPAANIVGYAFLTYRLRETHDPSRLLHGIATEMDAIRRWNLGQLFLDGLAQAESIPGALYWFTRGGQCWATTVLSNLGDVRRFLQPALRRVGREYLLGDAPLLRVIAAPPVRPGTHAAFLATICRDELTISLRVHPDRLSQDESDRLLQTYLNQLRRTANQTPATCPE